MRGLITAYRVKTFAWHGFDQLVVNGIPKLVLLPLLAALLGPAEFGVFVLALSVVQSVGLSPSNGFQGWILRSLEDYPREVWEALTGKAAKWAVLASLPFTVALLLSPWWAGRIFEAPTVALVLMGMAPYILSINYIETTLSTKRVTRSFPVLVRWHSLHLLAIVAAVILFWDGSPARIAWGVSVGSLAFALGALGGNSTQVPRLPGRLVRSARKQALSVWWPMSLSALLGLSAFSIDRVLVGVWLSAELVATYFAAASLASLVSVPFGLIAGWLLTMLGRIGEDFERIRRKWQMAFPLLVLAIGGLAVLAVFAGPSLLGLFYPELAADSLEVWAVLVLSAAARSAYVVIRPFVVKLADPRVLPTLTFLSLITKVSALIILVPLFGLVGAAYGTLLASIIVSAAWWISLSVTFSKQTIART